MQAESNDLPTGSFQGMPEIESTLLDRLRELKVKCPIDAVFTTQSYNRTLVHVRKGLDSTILWC
jgi:hypothetical protein